MRILLCAATVFEARACAAGVRGTPAGDRFEVLRTGVGAERAARSLGARLAGSERPDLVISTGFAGSLDPRHGVGDWVLARGRADGQGTSCAAGEAWEGALRRSGLRWKEARFALVSQVVSAAQDARARGFSTDVEVVDMETLALADAARLRAVPFVAFRMITDTPEEPIPEAVSAWAGALSLTDRAGRLLRGARSPRDLARFLRRASGFPGMLRDGWRELARQWSGAASADERLA